VPLKVLLVEGEILDSFSIEPDLLDRGDDVILTRNSRRAPSMALADWPDLIVLNTCSGLPDFEEVCLALKETEFGFPCLIVSRDEEPGYVPGGVYLFIPFSSRQLAQHIKKAIGNQCDRFFRVGDVALDQLTHQVQRSGRTEYLTPKEYKLLHLLMQHSGDVLNRRTIMKEVWETDYLGDTRTLDVHIRWVREKLEDNPSRPRRIITVRGVGYRFSPPATQ
jgi:two-component system OmpR family response regulator/two-component system alkaline phosphatase synthesis response regulator PhoP